jgi:hypothetical protein
LGLQVIAIDTGKEKEEMSMKMGASVSLELFGIVSGCPG